MKPLFAAIVLLALVAELKAVTIPTVPVGNAGNDNDPLTGGLYGGVAYNYRIGTTEVTNSQYVEFLNAKAASDPLALYSTLMQFESRAGISRSGSNGSYTYAAKPSMGNKPVMFVSWYGTIRFANWLSNGQGNGDTETGSYTLLGGTPAPSNGLSITRSAGATWVLPSENEWYKAAYHQPAAQGGDLDDYWLFATGSNSAPTLATASSSGDISNPGPNVANYNSGADWNGLHGNVTTVGSAGSLSQGFYGTFDQTGNVYEWNEALINSGRGIRGGGWGNGGLQSLNRHNQDPAAFLNAIGFRVALVPEPSTYVMAAFAILSFLALGHRRRKSITNRQQSGYPPTPT